MHWYSTHVEDCFTAWAMSVFMLIQYIDSLLRRCFLNVLYVLPFIAVPLIMVISYLIRKCFSTPGSRASLVCGYPPNYISSKHLQLCILFCCCFYVLYRYAYWDIYCCVDVMYTYVHTQYFLVLFLCVLMAWHLICYIQFGTQFVQNVNTVLVYTQHGILQPLWQCHNIFADHDHKWFMVSDDMYFLHKAVMMKFFTLCNAHSASLSLLLYHHLTLNRLFWQKHLDRGLQYLELYYTHSSCPVLSAINWLQGLYQKYLPSVGTRASKHHKISCKHLL